MIKKTLKKLGLSESASKVYLSLLEEGASDAGSLAKKLRIPRSSLYGYFSELTSLGLAKRKIYRNKKFWVAEPVTKISEIMTAKLNDLQNTVEVFEEEMSKIQLFGSNSFVNPSITYFEGPEEVKQMLKDVLLYRDIETIAFWSIKDAMKFLGEEFLKYLSSERAKRNIQVRVIWPEENLTKMAKKDYLGSGPEFFRDIRVAPDNLNTEMGYWIYENKVSFISSKKEAFGFIIESKELADLMRNNFEFIWKHSKNI